MSPVPKKLKKDSIVDAVFELRFDCREQREAPELVVGFMASNPVWRDFTRKRLPAADIPEQIRRADPNLQNQATLELQDPNGGRRVTLGAGTATTSRVDSYPGWETMRADITGLSSHAFNSLEDFSATRAGMRYVNVLVPEKHLVSSVHDFKLDIKIGDAPLNGGMNLNFIKVTETATHMVRIASPEFITNIRPRDGVAVVDIDSHTVDPNQLSNTDSIAAWADKAHQEEKEIFFGLFHEVALKEIVETWT